MILDPQNTISKIPNSNTTEQRRFLSYKTRLNWGKPLPKMKWNDGLCKLNPSKVFPLLNKCWNWLDQKLASWKLYYLHIHLFLTNKQSSHHIKLSCFLYFLNAQLFTLHNRSAIAIKTLSLCCPSGTLCHSPEQHQIVTGPFLCILSSLRIPELPFTLHFHIGFEGGTCLHIKCKISKMSLCKSSTS